MCACVAVFSFVHIDADNILWALLGILYFRIQHIHNNISITIAYNCKKVVLDTLVNNDKSSSSNNAAYCSIT